MWSHASGRAAKMLLRGWSLSGLATASTGRPVNNTVTRKASDMPDGNSRYQRPDLVPGVSIYAASFGQITSVLNAGAVGTGTPRRMQFMARIDLQTGRACQSGLRRAGRRESGI
jgi:hypothetical protein